MHLYFSLILSDGSVRGHSLMGMDLESQLDVLNMVVDDGNILLHAFIVDQDGLRTALPVKAFDGQPMGKTIKRLQSEYQLVLST